MKESRKIDTERVRECARALGEHCDTVHIVASRHEPETENGTVHTSFGLGNYYARVGQMREFLVKEDAISRAQALAGSDEQYSDED